ncbi:MAG: isoprenylcysteine carboxylmethyltransferase family protein [Bacteroidota bacterium]
MKALDRFKENKSFIVNIYIALNYFIFVVASLYYSFTEETLDYNIIAYTLHSAILIYFIVIRKPHKHFDMSFLHQCIALAGFYSGIIFIWQPETGGATEELISNIIIFAANILGAVTIFNLGRSFGIMIAVREIKTGGLYSLVRHPMYSTDLLLRIGFMVNHFNVATGILIFISIGFNFYRAILEEKYLSEQEEYRMYMQKVKYRFIPYVI